MTARWWHILLVAGIGYAIGYWMPKLGDMTLGKLYARKG